MLNKLKDDILRLLKEDEEFRYTVVGLLGLQRIEEAIARLADSHIELKNTVARLVDTQAKMESRLTRVEEAITRLIDIQAKVEARLVGIEEEQMSINGRIDRLEEAVVELKNTVLRLVDIQARQEERLTKLEEAWIRSEERLTKVEDRLVRVEERLLRVEERLEEHDRKYNAILEELSIHRAKLEEHDRKFNAILERLDEHTKILEEHTAELREHTKILEEHTRRFDDIVGMMIHGFDQMSRFAGISLESLVRSMLTKVMQDRDELPMDKELTSITIDSEEIDIFCDDPLIVGEVTSYADSIDEVYKLVKKVRLVRDMFNKDPKLILLIITNIKREVYDDIVREAEANRIEVIIGKRV